jgi:hypothetical protein
MTPTSLAIVFLRSPQSEGLCTVDASVIPLPLTPPAVCFTFASNPSTLDPKSNSPALDNSDEAQQICVTVVVMASDEVSPVVCPVVRAARKRLAKTGYRSLGSVRCQFGDGILTLHGSVPSYYHKQVAQEAIRNVTDVGAIVNELNVWS